MRPLRAIRTPLTPALALAIGLAALPLSACLGGGETRPERAGTPAPARAGRPAGTSAPTPEHGRPSSASPASPPATPAAPPDPLVSCGPGAASGDAARLAAGDSFRVLTIGDSVMWGQGLLPEQRFRAKARDHLAAALGVPVVEFPYAHSGATISTTDEVALADDDPRYLGWHGEVNRSFPLVEQQLERFVRERPEAATSVGLVLMDGGINDVNVMNMLDPRTDPAFIERRVEEYCRGSMTRLLRRVVAACPEARVIVTGYYAAISADSAVFSGMIDLPWGAAAAPQPAGAAPRRRSDADRDEFLAFLAAIGITVGLEAARSGGVEGAEGFGWIERMVGPGWIDPLRPIVVGWERFHARASAALAAACSEVDPTGRRICFVDPGFGPTNAAHATAPLLYPFRLTGAIDPLAAEREAACAAIFPLGKSRIICARASAGHPNPAGAERYFQALLAPLEDVARAERARRARGR